MLDQPTVQTVLLLIEFYQEAQASIMKEMARNERNKVSSTRHYCSLAREVMNESKLWAQINKIGYSLRALVKVYLVLETFVLDKKNAVAESDLWAHLELLLNYCIDHSWGVGHFSLGMTFVRRWLNVWPQELLSIPAKPSQGRSIHQPCSPLAKFLESVSCLLPVVKAVELCLT